jgi:hypothetical protein
MRSVGLVSVIWRMVFHSDEVAGKGGSEDEVPGDLGDTVAVIAFSVKLV